MGRCILPAVLWALLGCRVPAASAQSADTSTIAAPPTLPRPETALRRALMFPGLGQAYNRQFWKIPIVFAGVGASTGLAVFYGRQHRLYTRAFQYKGWQERVDRGEVDTHPYPEFEDEYSRVVAEIGGGRDIAASSLRPIRDKFRRNRDLSFFGVGLVYGLAALDAYISAHLLDFDVGEDLTVSVRPLDGRGAVFHVAWRLR
jgi:hypothetical protein